MPSRGNGGFLRTRVAATLVGLEVVLSDGPRIYLDFAWPELLLAIEANGYRHHARCRHWSPTTSGTNAVITLGWRILPVTWTELVERPDPLVALLRQARAA